MRIDLTHVSQGDLVLLAVKRMCCTGVCVLPPASLYSSLSTGAPVRSPLAMSEHRYPLPCSRRYRPARCAPTDRLAKSVAAGTLDCTLYTAIQAKRRYLPGKRVCNGQSAVSQATGIATDKIFCSLSCRLLSIGLQHPRQALQSHFAVERIVDQDHRRDGARAETVDKLQRNSPSAVVSPGRMPSSR